MYYTRLYIMAEPTCTSERELCMPYIYGVSTPIPSERKPYMPYVMGVGSPIPFEEVESFSYIMCCGCGYNHAI